MYDDLKRLPLLTAEEEKTASADTLVERNIRLVTSQIQMWMDRGVDEDDLIQEGILGLTKAAHKFDPEVGRFSTYATFWITDALRRAVQKSGPVNHPIYVQQEADSDTLDLSFVPAGTTGDEGEYDPPDENAMSAEETAELNDWRNRIQRGLDRLTPRERRMVERYYGIDGETPETGAEIAAAEGISPNRVSQIRIRAEEKIRKRG